MSTLFVSLETHNDTRLSVVVRQLLCNNVTYPIGKQQHQQQQQPSPLRCEPFNNKVTHLEISLL